MAINEGFVVDGLDFNSLAGALALETLKVPPAPKKPEWAQSADVDGASLVRDPLFDNRTIEGTLRVQPQATMDLALAQVALVSDKFEESERQVDGLPIIWTPHDSAKTQTLYALTGEIDDTPITIDGSDAGWFVNAPLVSFKITAKPFGYGVELGSFTDAFATDTVTAGNWTFDAGATNQVTVTGGVLNSTATSPTVEKRLIHTSSPYTLPDCQVTLKATPGATISGYKAGVILKRVDAANYIEAYVDDNGTNSRLRIDVIIGGVRTNRQTNNLAGRISNGTAFWMRARMEGNDVYAEYWTAAPTATGTATLAPTLYTLASGSEQNTLGRLIKGRPGLVWAPQVTAVPLDDFAVDPHTYVSTNPVVLGCLVGVPGDVPAEGRLIVIERANKDRSYLEWGLEQRYADPTLALILDSDNLVTAGFNGTGTTRAGAYDPGAAGNSVIRTVLAGSPVACCGTGTQSHVGTFRVKARVWAPSTNCRFRLAWQEGDGPFSTNAYGQAVAANTFQKLDLGTITIPAAQLGTQRWQGKIEAYSTTPGESVDVDYLELVPTEGWGKSRSAWIFETPSSFTGRDEFNQTAGALTGKTAAVGGNWAGAGSATDFQVETTGHTAQRTATGDVDINTGRYGVSGVAASAAQVSQVDVRVNDATLGGAGGACFTGVLARYVDTNNWLRGSIYFLGGGYFIWLEKRVAAAVTTLKSAGILIAGGLSAPTPYYTVRVQVDAGGHWFFWVYQQGAAPSLVGYGTDSDLATGGALASGKPGIYDGRTGATALTRNFDNFLTFAPTPRISLYAGRQAEFRADGELRQDSTGVYYGPPPNRRGGRFLVPPAGDKARSARVLLEVDRNDLDLFEDVPLADPVEMRIAYTPRYTAPPR